MADLVLLEGDDLVTGTIVMVLVVLLVLGVLGVLERRRNQARLDRVPVRVSVNGSRGKSTVTRLLTGALTAGGHRTLGKVTGTMPTLLLGWSGEEIDVRRRPEGPNIGEQRLVTQRADREHADAMVIECMAVDPEYQLTFHRDLLDANLLVICNALDDHLDEMGPTIDDVAEVFAASIPAGGTVVVVPDRHTELYRRVADERGARLVVADPQAVTESHLSGFEHLVFADHVALVLAVTRELGIDDTAALRGMRRAPVDPYATRVVAVGDPVEPAFFVNGFAANDPASTLAVWDHLRTRALPCHALTVIVHCREDRVSRTELFATDVLPRLPIDTLVVTGELTRPVLDAVASGSIDVRRVADLTGRPSTDAVEVLVDQLTDRIVYGVGNLHGGGAELVAALEALSVEVEPSATRGAA